MDPLSETLDAATQYTLVNMTSTVLCNSTGISPDVVKGKAVAVMRGDCDFSLKATVAQNLGATALLIASNTTLIIPSANDSEYQKVYIPLALMRHRDFVEAQQEFGDGMQVKMYAPPHIKIDPSIAVILLISMVTVVLGGYWSGACERWIWILQDLLGIAFCLNFLKTISLSNFKNGVSIMVQVALGPDASGERLPVVMRVPRFLAWAQNLCGMQFSILAYFLGMILTFVVMLLSGMGQPALLYLVPFTLITSAVVAGCRGEMRQFWAGTTYEVS
ncbi:hypothetical protein INR49_020222 [Caranx melampygus]|nr:hypothetical protein INR49_020222 [Caranx melampygus]